MTTQPTKNKPMVYVWHHFILLPALLILAIYGIRRYAAVFGDDSEESRLWFTVMALAVVGFGVLVLLRQHYALTLQDRIIRLEVRQQYFEATGESFRPLESQLELSQILALRFAGDAELAALVQATIREKLSSKDIQARMQEFHFDHMRV